MAWKVLFFQTSRGERPAQKFLDNLDTTTRAKAALSIRLLVNQGPFLKPPYIKKLQGRLYELRISGKTAVRIFYIINNNEYCLLHAFKKKTQKTPSKDLKIALDRMKKII